MSTAQLTSRSTMKALAALSGLCLAAGALAGCGSSAPTHSATTATAMATPARATPAPSNADVGSALAQVKADKGTGATDRSRSSVTASDAGGALSTSPAAASSHPVDRVSRGHGVQHARSTPSSSNDDPSNAGVRPINPCTLVTAPEARSITAGSVVGTTEAPLGPTCIYRSAKAKSDITMTVEALKLSQVTQKLSQRSQFRVKSHPAYCGRLGSQMLFVPLTNGQVLNVVAPCSVARQFASVALGRLAA